MEHIGNILNDIHGPVRIFQQGSFRCHAQYIEKEMRIHLRLQRAEFCIFQKCLQPEQLLLVPEVLPNPLLHLIEGLCQPSDLILLDNGKILHLVISLHDLSGLFR